MSGAQLNQFPLDTGWETTSTATVIEEQTSHVIVKCHWFIPIGGQQIGNARKCGQQRHWSDLSRQGFGPKRRRRQEGVKRRRSSHALPVYFCGIQALDGDTFKHCGINVTA